MKWDKTEPERGRLQLHRGRFTAVKGWRVGSVSQATVPLVKGCGGFPTKVRWQGLR